MFRWTGHSDDFWCANYFQNTTNIHRLHIQMITYQYLGDKSSLQNCEDMSYCDWMILHQSTLENIWWKHLIFSIKQMNIHEDTADRIIESQSVFFFLTSKAVNLFKTDEMIDSSVAANQWLVGVVYDCQIVTSMKL